MGDIKKDIIVINFFKEYLEIINFRLKTKKESVIILVYFQGGNLMIKKLFLLSILTLAMAGCSDSGLATELITKSTEATTEELKCGNDHSDYRGLNRRCMGILGRSNCKHRCSNRRRCRRSNRKIKRKIKRSKLCCASYADVEDAVPLNHVRRCSFMSRKAGDEPKLEYAFSFAREDEDNPKTYDILA
ncbi:hypothetical protein KD892_13115 [Enterococcus faecium]|uniref:hypothetical protein n=1 Tax=Enterococcus faecium TaxID=1352 RepID=UPI0027A8B335|nr:hypothetical protein E3T36_07180 [Enterococcus faecium]